MLCVLFVFLCGLTGAFVPVCNTDFPYLSAEDINTTMCYTREGLFAVRHSLPPLPIIPISLVSTLRAYGLHIRPPTVRGHRAGNRHQRSIPVVISSYRKHHCVSSNHVNMENITPIHLSTFNTELKMCTLNARSVRNKTTEIYDYIIDHDIDVLGVTETWLKSGSQDKITIGNLTPSGYTLHHVPRSKRKGGGVALIFRENFKITAKKTANSFKSFEYMERQLVSGSSTFQIAIVYRPPPSCKNESTTAQFMEDFEAFLLNRKLYGGHDIISGDFNFHVDVDDPDSSRFLALLYSHGYTQLVTETTHNSGPHTRSFVYKILLV